MDAGRDAPDVPRSGRSGGPVTGGRAVRVDTGARPGTDGGVVLKGVDRRGDSGVNVDTGDGTCGPVCATRIKVPCASPLDGKGRRARGPIGLVVGPHSVVSRRREDVWGRP